MMFFVCEALKRRSVGMRHAVAGCLYGGFLSLVVFLQMICFFERGRLH